MRITIAICWRNKVNTIRLEAETRKEFGKGPSRRSRSINIIPGVLYGGAKDALAISLKHHKVQKALEQESIYSSVFDIKVDGKVEHVILKSLQRHPYKPTILHIDFQRVGAKDVLVRAVPIHFINQELCEGVKAGGFITHSINQIEVRCQVKNLPDFIEVDMTNVKLEEVLHLSDLVFPKDVELAVDLLDASHNLPVVSVRMPRKIVEEVEEEKPEETAEAEVPTVEEAKTTEDESQ